MSYGLAVCSSCHCEVHQGSNRVWFHCQTMTPICEGAAAIYPKNADGIAGLFCGADDLDDEYKLERERRKRQAKERRNNQ